MKPSPIASIIMFVGAAMVLFAIISTGWFSFSMDVGDGERVSNAFGVLRSEGCYKGRCESQLIFKNMRLEPELVFALLTLLAGLAAAVFGVIAGIFLMKRGRTSLSLVTLIVTGVAFLFAIILILVIKVKSDGPKVSYASFIFMLGSAGLITASIMAMVRPRSGAVQQRAHAHAHAQSQPFPQGGQQGQPYGQQSQPYQQPQMQQPQQYSPQGYPQQAPQPQPQQQPQQSNPQGSPPCPTCGQPATWVAQYNRWFCTRENKYL